MRGVSVVKKRNMTQTNEQIDYYAAHIKHAFSHFFPAFSVSIFLQIISLFLWQLSWVTSNEHLNVYYLLMTYLISLDFSFIFYDYFYGKLSASLLYLDYILYYHIFIKSYFLFSSFPPLWLRHWPEAKQYWASKTSLRRFYRILSDLLIN